MLFAFPSENMEGLDFKLFVYSRKALRQSRYDSKVWDGGGGQPDGVVISYLIFGMRQGMGGKMEEISFWRRVKFKFCGTWTGKECLCPAIVQQH